VLGDDLVLEKYLALSPETNLDLDVLAWWKARDHHLPGDPATGRPAGLPHQPTWPRWQGSSLAARHPRPAWSAFSRWRASYTAT
jgi:hypothetical protein